MIKMSIESQKIIKETVSLKKIIKNEYKGLHRSVVKSGRPKKNGSGSATVLFIIKVQIKRVDKSGGQQL